MKILAIDTATEACSAALLIDEEVTQRYEIAPRKHGELILPMIDGLLAQAELKATDLDAIAFGQGPGSFTGLRIAAGVTQGIAFAADIGVVPVSTLAAMAYAAIREQMGDQVFAAIDARMSQVYCGAYIRNAEGLPGLQNQEQVIDPDNVELPGNGDWIGVGSGWGAYEQQLSSQLGIGKSAIHPDCFPQAKDIATLAAPVVRARKVLTAEQAIPVYLRDKVAKKKRT